MKNVVRWWWCLFLLAVGLLAVPGAYCLHVDANLLSNTGGLCPADCVNHDTLCIHDPQLEGHDDAGCAAHRAGVACVFCDDTMPRRTCEAFQGAQGSCTTSQYVCYGHNGECRATAFGFYWCVYDPREPREPADECGIVTICEESA